MWLRSPPVTLRVTGRERSSPPLVLAVVRAVDLARDLAFKAGVPALVPLHRHGRAFVPDGRRVTVDNDGLREHCAPLSDDVVDRRNRFPDQGLPLGDARDELPYLGWPNLYSFGARWSSDLL
jgi:hypothetical protein